jgi:hypothetical protein
VHAVELGVGLGMVAALVRSPALLARKAGSGYEARQGEGVLGQLAQARCFAPQAGQAPERRARLG